MERYSRHIILPEIGVAGQKRIRDSRVLVIGAGGLGCPLLQYLTAAGIGEIGIIDFDIVELSNLQRQILFQESDIGKNKAETVKARLQKLNSEVQFTAYPIAIDFQNAINIIENYDIVVDGTDNFETRYLVNDICVQLSKPLIYGAIYKFEGQVSVFNYQNGPTYRCLFPEPPKNGVPNCSEVGVLGVLPGIIGTMQANEVLKIILEIPFVLSGQLVSYSAKTGETHKFRISANQKLIREIKDRNLNPDTYRSISDCETSTKEVSVIAPDQIQFNEKIQWIDVRNAGEVPVVDHPNILKIPLSSLADHIPHHLDKNQKTIVFCQSGMRSKRAVAILQQHQFKEIYSLGGGAVDIQSLFKTQIVNGKENQKCI